MKKIIFSLALVLAFNVSADFELVVNGWPVSETKCTDSSDEQFFFEARSLTWLESPAVGLRLTKPGLFIIFL